MRIHEEETNLLCTLAMDASGSMDFRGIADRTRKRVPPARSFNTPNTWPRPWPT